MGTRSARIPIDPARAPSRPSLERLDPDRLMTRPAKLLMARRPSRGLCASLRQARSIGSGRNDVVSESPELSRPSFRRAAPAPRRSPPPSPGPTDRPMTAGLFKITTLAPIFRIRPRPSTAWRSTLAISCSMATLWSQGPRSAHHHRNPEGEPDRVRHLWRQFFDKRLHTHRRRSEQDCRKGACRLFFWPDLRLYRRHGREPDDKPAMGWEAARRVAFMDLIRQHSGWRGRPWRASAGRSL